MVRLYLQIDFPQRIHGWHIFWVPVYLRMPSCGIHILTYSHINLHGCRILGWHLLLHCFLTSEFVEKKSVVSLNIFSLWFAFYIWVFLSLTWKFNHFTRLCFSISSLLFILKYSWTHSICIIIFYFKDFPQLITEYFLCSTRIFFL